MKFPILLFSDGDVEAYQTLRDAEMQMEAIDVRDGVYRAFDAEGRELRIDVIVETQMPGRIWKFLFGALGLEVETVQITENPESRPEIDVLRDLLRRFGDYCGLTAQELATLSLEELIAAVPVHGKRTA